MMSAFGGEFNRSTQHLLILPDGEVSDGVACTDMVHAEAASRALGALEDRFVFRARGAVLFHSKFR